MRKLLSSIVLSLSIVCEAQAISKEKHGVLTKAALSEYSNCVGKLGITDTLSIGKLQIIKATTLEDESPILERYFNWHFYDEYRGTEDAMAKSLTFANKSLHKIYAKRINQLYSSLVNNNQNGVYEFTGRVLHYIQDMTVPAHVAPIYHYKFLFIDNSDHFDEMPEWENNNFDLDLNFCEITSVDVDNLQLTLETILSETADDTRNRIKENIIAPEEHRLAGKTWEEFWVLRNPKDDDDYPNVKSGFAPYGNEKREGFKTLCETDKDICLDFFAASYQKAFSNTVKTLLIINQLNDHHK